MEYKIGQIFEVKGKWYQFVECNGTCCDNCVFNQGLKCMYPDISMQCARFFRTDGKNGHAVLLDAIGGEYKQGDAIFRDYRCQTKPVTTDRRVYISNSDSEVGLIVSIRLKSLNGIERKMGEVFEYNGEWYQCVRGTNCCECDFNNNNVTCDIIGELLCTRANRSDETSVIFKKLEKVGEPYNIGKKVFQRYEVFTKPYIFNDEFFTINTPVDDSFISVEIKQNEDMEEDNNTKHSNSENIGKNLKPFDLQAAKSGKPVCTRNGRKARIIYFDAKGGKPIIALIEYEIDERPCNYFANGRFYSNPNENNDADLMMLPEKKEGWVNVYKETSGEYYMDKIIHKTEKFALDMACPDNYIGTVKIEWYE